ncbi:Uncharacterized protein HZ326_24763 [Fusarium oxysporum f. sp. albedinis]|nr:Uncharacterized protein HZ326_24763 [Fusarium oxysporum f. sp. albedinis]
MSRQKRSVSVRQRQERSWKRTNRRPNSMPSRGLRIADMYAPACSQSTEPHPLEFNYIPSFQTNADKGMFAYRNKCAGVFAAVQQMQQC